MALTVGDWAIAEDVSELIEAIAVVTIGLTVVVALLNGAIAWYRTTVSLAMEKVKRQIGRGLLLGLDLLIAADVIRTVTLQPTLENVGALGLLVVVRTFLAWSLVVELSGRWPWQRDPNDGALTEG